MAKTSRRVFLQNCVAGSTSIMLSSLLNGTNPELGYLCLTLAARGGWDVTSFCDPKDNVPGQPMVNTWSRDGATIETVPGTAMRYAPWANNQAFFDTFASDMMVINGIDSQTNAHLAGERSMWSGQLNQGYPSVGSLVLSERPGVYPLGYLSNGGYRKTAGLAAYTQVNNPATLRNLIRVRASEWNRDVPLINSAEYDLIQQVQQARNARLRAQDTGVSLSFRALKSLEDLIAARAGEHLMERLDALLPESSSATDQQGLENRLIQQIDLILAAYRAGLCVTGALVLDGFDTHRDHDARHEVLFQKLTNGIQYLFSQAESFGIAPQIKLVVGSEFSRTPVYNSDDGKDHWPIGSALFMQKNVQWGGRTIGLTDPMHNGLLIDPMSFETSTRGIQLQTRHFQAASRQFFGIEQTVNASQFPLDSDGIDFFQV